MTTNAAALGELSAVVLGNLKSWPGHEGDFGVFCDRADAHGILPLVAEQLAGRLSPACRLTLERRLKPRVVADLVRERELEDLLETFDAAGVSALVIKGAALAYTVYPRPDLRPRMDTDLLIGRSDVAEADRTLQALGYRPVPQLTADLVMYQRAYERRYPTGVAHTVDLHWRLSNPQRFGEALSHGELLSRARPIPALGDAARGPDWVDALLIACIHRIAHHLDAERLIWSYDIHLVAERLDPLDWLVLMSRARERQVSLACHRGLLLARDRFGTKIGSSVLEALAAAAASERPMQTYLGGHSRHVFRVVEDFRSIGSMRGALRLARQHVLPPSSYMREVYAPASNAPLPWLYAKRAWSGARRWLVRP